MAKNDTEKEEVAQAETPKETPVHGDRREGAEGGEPEKSTPMAHVVKHQPPWPLIVIGVVATVLVIAVVAVGWLQLESLRGTTRTASRYSMQQDGTNFGGGQGEYYGNGGGSMRSGRASRPTLSGVVTALTDTTVTVSGSGKQVTVDKTSNTTISGDSSTLAVNDTVLVYGTTNSDGTVSATRIVVRNGATASGVSDSAPAPSV